MTKRKIPSNNSQLQRKDNKIDSFSIIILKQASKQNLQ